MTSFYSPSTNALYQSATYDETAPENGLVPTDSVLIEDVLHDELIANLKTGGTISYTAGQLPVAVPQTDAQKLAIAQQAKIAALKTEYEALINAPVSFTNVAGIASTYPSGDTVALNRKTARQNLEDALAIGAANWNLNLWLDTNNVAQTFTYADLQGLAGAMAAGEQKDWAELVKQIAAVQAATTIDAVNAIAW